MTGNHTILPTQPNPSNPIPENDIFNLFLGGTFLDWKALLYSPQNYLEPKWPLFWLEKAFFWGVDLEK